MLIMKMCTKQGFSTLNSLRERQPLYSLYEVSYYGMLFHLLCFEPQNAI